MRAKTTRIVALCSVANFINSADRIILPIAIIPMKNHHNWTLHWQGWILSSFAFGYITSQIIGASAATKYGGKRVLTFSVLLWSMATLLTPAVASNAYMLIIFRILLGLGEGLGLPTTYNIIAEAVPIDERSRAFSYLVGAGTIGQTFAALICPHLAWEWMFYSFGFLGVAWVILWLICYQDIPAKVQTEAEEPLFPTKPLFAKHMRWNRFFSKWPFWAIYIAHFSMNWTNYIVMQWLPTYLVSKLGANRESISLTAVPYIVNSLSGIGAGHVADSLLSSRQWSVLSVRRLMTVIGLVGPGIFLLCFCTVNSLLSAVLYISLSMALCAFNSPGHLSNHADIAPNHAGLSFAISNTIATIPGILCGPLTAELVTQSHGRWFPVFVLAAAMNFVGAIIYLSQSSASQLL